MQAVPSRRLWGAFLDSRRLPLIGFLLLLSAYFGLTNRYFFTLGNLTTVLSQVSVLGILAVGETFVILLSGIDLSVGSILAISGVLSATLALHHVPVVLAMLSGVVIGLVIGLFNGFFSYAWGMASFIVTLAMLSLAGGLALVITNGSTVFGFPNSFNYLGSATFAGIPVSVFILVGAFVVGHLVLKYTVFGRTVYAVGGNPNAAKLSGINVTAVGIKVFMISGGLAGLATLINTGRLASAIPIAGQTILLPTIAAVVIGGTSLFGGVGSLGGTFVGVLLIGVLNNGLAISNVSAFWDQAVQGVVIFVAVAIDALAQRRTART
ncbi:MAG: ABC transporter permease [Actinomycetota bacterium]|nr:ABC transporter permease [Actinomycetota bacterium]